MGKNCEKVRRVKNEYKELSLKETAKAVGQISLRGQVVLNTLSLMLDVRKECQSSSGYIISLKFRGIIQAGDR